MTLFKPAQRTQAKLRLAIEGPSGSGKTYSALLIAKGLAGGDLAKVALIDTEKASGNLYDHLGPYAVAAMHAPYTVAKYLQAIAAAEAEGFEVIIIDSLTHAWSGAGGVLEFVTNVGKAQTKENTFAAWQEGTPLQNQLIDAMLSSSCHIIATMRSKTEWVLELNKKGKMAPRKVGLAPDQRKDVDYEFTLVLDLSREHMATAGKDRTGLFDERVEEPTEKMGAELATWLGSAAPPKPAPAASSAVQQDQQREQAAAQQQASPPAGPAPAGNGTITPAQWEQLRAVIHAKSRTEKAVLEMAQSKGLGNGRPSGLPATCFANLLATLSGLPDPQPPQPTAPAAAPVPAAAISAEDFAEPAQAAQELAGEAAATAATTEASEAAVATQEPPAAQEAAEDDDGFGELDAELNAAAANQEAAENKTRKRKATVTAQQLTRLGAQCGELEELGVGRDEWRLYVLEKEGVSSRKDLTKAAATRCIDYLQRWITDVKTGVVGPNERAVA